MTIHLTVLYIIVTCIFGALSVVGILYHDIRKKSAVGVDSENEEEVSTENKTFPLKYSIIYCVIVFILILVVALWLLLHFNNLDTIYMCKRVALVSILFVATYYDKLAYRIPNKLILYGLFCRVILLIFELIFSTETVSSVLISEFIGAGGLLVFSVIGLIVTRNGIGMGDIKLFILMGLFQGLTGIVSSVFASLIVSFVYSVFLLITRKKSRKDYIAFAPCILVGTYFSVMLLGC